jgi:hypothetical protein
MWLGSARIGRSAQMKSHHAATDTVAYDWLQD